MHMLQCSDLGVLLAHQLATFVSNPEFAWLKGWFCLLLCGVGFWLAMPRKSQKKPDANALNGLADMWNKNRHIREHLLQHGQLFKWPSPMQVGVVTFETAAFNFRVLARLLRLCLPKLDTLRTINIDAARKEARHIDLLQN